jgi:FAD:protein FMN transferase
MERDSMRRAKPLLGTFVEIWASGASAIELEAAIEAAFGAVAKVHRLMSFHESGSDVSRLNRGALTAGIKVDPWTFRVLETALELHRHSGGIFDITIAAALQRLGVLPEAPNFPGRDGAGVTAARRGSATRIELLPDYHVRFHSPDTLIDLGGIAKGFAVDCAIGVLKEQSIPAALVNAGGDLAAYGPGSYPIHVRDPSRPDRAICAIEVRNEALATSGARFDPVCDSSSPCPEIIDPKTQAPAFAIAGVTVCAPSCMIADASTKVVMIAGEAAAPLLDRYNAKALMISREGDVCFTSGLGDGIGCAA